MKIKTLSLVSLVALSALTARADSKGASQSFDNSYYSIQSVEVQEVPDSVLTNENFKDIDQLQQLQSTNMLGGALEPVGVGQAALILDQIINIGSKIWAIVEKNKPVVNVINLSANAVPEGLSSWQQIQQWRAPFARNYQVIMKNFLRMTVVNFIYRVQFTYGGNVDGKGLYLSAATVLPAQLKVLWGYHFNSQVSVANITNAGTHDSPLAALELQLKWSVDTVIKHHEETDSFYLRGDGYFRQL